VNSIKTPATPATTSTPLPTETLGGRICATCACFVVVTNPQNVSQQQGFCRRNAAREYEMKIPQQQVVNGVPRIDRHSGAPIMEQVAVTGYMYDRTLPGGSCFDGWRPIGSLPGERLVDSMLRAALPQFIAIVSKDLPPELRSLLEQVRDAMAPVIKPVEELT
jgi:hypothetical protein